MHLESRVGGSEEEWQEVEGEPGEEEGAGGEEQHQGVAPEPPVLGEVEYC